MIVFDVIIPTFNRLGMLKEAIASVLNQSFLEYRVIVVDAASTDGTIDYLNSLRDEKLQIIQCEDNRGMAGNWNRAIALSRAQYVMLFHDDDIMHKDFLSQQYRMFQKYRDMVFCHSSARLINDRGDRVGSKEMKVPENISGADYLTRVVTQSGLVPVPPTVVINRALLNRKIIFDSEIEPLADIFCWLELTEYGSVGYINEELISYRIHDKSVTGIFMKLFQRKLEYRKCFMDKMIVLLVKRSAFCLSDARKIMKKYTYAGVGIDILNLKKSTGSLSHVVKSCLIVIKVMPGALTNSRCFASILAALFMPYNLSRSIYRRLVSFKDRSISC
ncbi:MAG TPA: glycosyltransferase [Chromatiales bacterium]|nr:glycosyltransferase [Chromatiales bacterium]